MHGSIVLYDVDSRAFLGHLDAGAWYGAHMLPNDSLVAQLDGVVALWDAPFTRGQKHSFSVDADFTLVNVTSSLLLGGTPPRSDCAAQRLW